LPTAKFSNIWRNFTPECCRSVADSIPRFNRELGHLDKATLRKHPLFAHDSILHAEREETVENSRFQARESCILPNGLFSPGPCDLEKYLAQTVRLVRKPKRPKTASTLVWFSLTRRCRLAPVVMDVTGFVDSAGHRTAARIPVCEVGRRDRKDRRSEPLIPELEHLDEILKTTNNDSFATGNLSIADLAGSIKIANLDLPRFGGFHESSYI